MKKKDGIIRFKVEEKWGKKWEGAMIIITMNLFPLLNLLFLQKTNQTLARAQIHWRTISKRLVLCILCFIFELHRALTTTKQKG